MNRKASLTVSLFSLILTALPVANSHAHPNHMSFENIEHEARINQAEQVIKTRVLLHDTQEQRHKHRDIIPCKETQHKASPCKKK